jgi:hypothetical protein
MTRFTHEQMADELARMIYGKATWLADFAEGRKTRPDHEIEQKRIELAVLRHAESDYRAAAQRGKAA